MSQIICNAVCIVAYLMINNVWAQSGLGQGYEFDGNGKIQSGHHFTEPFKETTPGVDFKVLNISGFRTDLQRQLKYLRIKNISAQGSKSNLIYSNTKLQQVIEMLLAIDSLDQNTLSEKFTMYQMAGEDDMGNVHFTGYFTPEMHVSSYETEIFKHPIYTLPEPEHRRYTRAQIDTQHLLKNKALEIAWSADLLSNYFLQVQGSGIAIFEDGSRKTFVYAGQNRRAYVSLGKFLVENGKVSKEEISLSAIRIWFDQHPEELEDALNRNPSYVYFNLSDDVPKGGARLPLSAGVSAAVDIGYVPYGSCLIAKVPVLNDAGHFSHHEYRLLLAHDRGGAIKKGHIDLYTGSGNVAKKRADYLHHYGHVWLLMPKKSY